MGQKKEFQWKSYCGILPYIIKGQKRNWFKWEEIVACYFILVYKKCILKKGLPANFIISVWILNFRFYLPSRVKGLRNVDSPELLGCLCYSWQDPWASCLGFFLPSPWDPKVSFICSSLEEVSGGHISPLWWSNVPFFRGLLLRLCHHPLLFHPLVFRRLPSLNCCHWLCWFHLVSDEKTRLLSQSSCPQSLFPDQQHQPHLVTWKKCSVSGPIRSYWISSLFEGVLSSLRITALSYCYFNQRNNTVSSELSCSPNFGTCQHKNWWFLSPWNLGS